MKKIPALFVTFLALTAFAGTGFLGVTLQTINNTDEGSENNGVYIINVLPETGASEAGLKNGDQITEINGQEISIYADLEQAMANLGPGDTANITVLRNGKEMQSQVTLGERPDSGRKWAFEFASDRTFLGVSTEELSGQLANFFKVESGLLVKDVENESPAQKAGLLAGDVILAIDGKPLKRNVELLKAVLARKENEEVVLSIKRNNKDMEFSAILEKAPQNLTSKYKTSPYVIGLSDLDSQENAEFLENLPQFLEGFNFNFEMPEMGENLKDVLGADFKEKLEKEMEQLREQLQALEKENRELIKKTVKEKGELH